MKFNCKKLFIKLTFMMLVFSFKNATAQVINCSLLNGTYGGTIAATSGTAWTTYNNYGPGYYMQWPVLNGGSYAISTCGASIDDQITVWGGFNTNMLLYNDDNGPFCTGSAASGNFVPNLTNYVYMFITEYPCLQGGTSSINVLYRQNNNLVFTSSSGTICSGQSRTLTALPVSVGTVPNSTFGDPGTFTGAGVSGNVFTAPTVSVVTNYTITYTFGYVSQTQVLTVVPGAGLSVVPSSTSVCNGYPLTLTAAGANTYTWTGSITNGVAFNPTVSAVYTVTSTDGLGCKNFRAYSVDVGDVPSNQTFSLAQPSSCGSGSATVNLNNSEYGVLYTLINASNNAALSSPVAGNGSSITITSSLIASTTTVGVQAAINPTNGALAFDGVNDFITASNSVTSSQGTWEAWVFKNNWAAHNDDNLFGNGIPFPNSNSFYISLHPVVGFHFRYGSTSDPGNNYVSHILTQNLPASTWHHLAATWQTTSGTTSLVLYVDGYVMATNTSTANISLGSTIYMGGANTSTIIVPFGAGKMDEVKVWNVARTPAQIVADMGSYASGSISNLAYYWNMEDGTGSGIAQNVSASVNSATLTNMNTSTAWTTRPRAGCVVNLTQTPTFTILPVPTITVNSGTICSGNSFTITPSGASTYTIQGGSSIVNPISSTSYTVLGTSAAGCLSSNTETSNVTVNTTPTISVNSGSICYGTNFTITPSGASTYTIEGGSTVVSPSVSTNYTVVGSSTASCISNIVTSTITINTKITTASGNWNNPAIWTPTGVPTACDRVIIDNTHNVTINTNAVCASLLVGNGSAATLQFGATGYSLTSSNVTLNSSSVLDLGAGTSTLEVTGNIINNGNFIPQQGLVQFVGTNLQTISGTTPISFYNVIQNNTVGTSLATTVNLINALTINNGTLNANGNLTMISTASNTARIDPITGSGDILGNVTVQRYAPGGATGWALLGTPITSPLTFASWDDNFPISCATCPSGSAGGFTSIYSYDETIPGSYSIAAAYLPITNITDPILPSTGYWVYLGNGSSTTTPITIDVTGTLGKFNIPITLSVTSSGSNADDGWNLITNPYPSAISWAALKGSTTGIDNAIYTFNADLNGGAGNTAAYVNGVSSPAVGSGGIGDDIPMGQGFYVHSTGATLLNATETVKTSANPTFLKVSSTSTLQLLRLNLDGLSNYHDEIALYIQPSATDNFDPNYDAIKQGSQDPLAPSIYLDNGLSTFQINGISLATNTFSMPLKTTTGYNGTYTISLTDYSMFPATSCINIFDTYSGITTDLKLNDYVFTLSDTTSVARFVFNINNPTLNTINTNTTTICDGDTIALMASGAVNYNWSNGATTMSIIVAPNTTTNYSVSTTMGSCINSSAITITVLPTPTVLATSSSSILCVGQSATLTANGAVTYSWSTGNNSSNEVVLPIITTSYSVIGIDINGCKNISTITQSVSVCTGINNVGGAFESTINVYPNPTTGMLNVISTDPINKLTITNTLGQIVLNETTSIQHASFNIQHFAPGLYILKVESNGMVKTVRLIKD